MNEIERLQKKLDNTNFVLGTLIVWLQRELGTKNCEDLIAQLNKEPEETSGGE